MVSGCIITRCLPRVGSGIRVTWGFVTLWAIWRLSSGLGSGWTGRLASGSSDGDLSRLAIMGDAGARSLRGRSRSWEAIRLDRSPQLSALADSHSLCSLNV